MVYWQEGTNKRRVADADAQSNPKNQNGNGCRRYDKHVHSVLVSGEANRVSRKCGKGSSNEFVTIDQYSRNSQG
jgi:hypothetical protein